MFTGDYIKTPYLKGFQLGKQPNNTKDVIIYLLSHLVLLGCINERVHSKRTGEINKILI